MKKKRNALMGIGLLFLLLLTMAVPVFAEEQEEENEVITSDILYTIGVVLFDQENPELNMFMDYYKNYIEEGFPVKFYFSRKLESTEEENAFIEEMAELGADGIISFYGLDVESTVEVCEENELYYVLGSGTISDDDFQAVKNNPWFLGTVGPDPQEEYNAGKSMAEYFVSEGKKSFLIASGGASSGNFMHLSRLQGIQDVLDAQTGVEETVSDGYLTREDGIESFKEALKSGSYDVVLCTMGLGNDVLDAIAEKEEEQGADIQIGMVDCFSEENFGLVKEKDAFGNPIINFIEGKYASMVGPAFAILYNAMSGHTEANSENGEAVRLYQGFWQSSSKEEFIELYGYTQGIYENAYDCESLMDVISVFSENASPENLKALTEAYKIEDVKARISER